jgi:hypothetical protein
MIRFPMRTVILMVAALFSFGWMWWRTHEAGQRDAAKPRFRVTEFIDLTPVPDAGGTAPATNPPGTDAGPLAAPKATQ